MKSTKKQAFLTPKNETRITLIGKSGEFGSPTHTRVYPQDVDEDQYSATNFSIKKKKTITPQQLTNGLQNIEDEEGAVS
jgi:hypothetical protein